MKETDRIGIISWFGANNYGSNIQAAALQKALKSLGFNATNISMEFNPDKAGSFKNSLFLCFNRIRKRICKSAFKELTGSVRKNNITRFVEGETEFQVIDRHSQYPSFANSYTAFITGSDQLWNPDYINPFTTLCFAGSKKRISYATSVGTSSIPESKLHAYQPIAGYGAVSVREHSAKELISKAVNREDIVVTADPTILLPREEYIAMTEKAVIPERIRKDRPFVFCYFVGQREEYIKHVAEIAAGREVICISGDLNCQTILEGTRFEEAGPYEWLWLIANAECVVTDSYHATVLSLILHTPFCVLKRFNDTDVKSQNSRLVNLFETVGGNLRFGSVISSEEDFEKAREHFCKLREASISYLLKALE